MIAHNYFIGFMLVFLFTLLLLLLEMILNMRNTIIELSFFSDDKLGTLDRNLNKKFGVRFQVPFELLEFLVIGYIVYELLTDLRLQGLELNTQSFNQLIFFFVVIMAVMVGDAILIAKDLHIYKFIKNYAAIAGKNSDN